MDRDVRLALLGDHEAAKRVTDAGVLIPCAHCGNDDDTRITLLFKKDRKKRMGIYYEICTIRCECCSESVKQAGAGKNQARKNAIMIWNMRTNIGDIQ